MSHQTDSDDTFSSIRVMTFADRDDCALVFIRPDGVYPPIKFSHPITLSSMRLAMKEAGIPPYKIRVGSMAYVGRMTSAIRRIEREESAERAQRHKEHEASLAVILKTSASTLEQERAALILEKHQVDDELRRTQVRLSEARATAYTSGRYMDPSHYRQQERKVVQLRERSLAIQSELGKLRIRIKTENRQQEEKREEKRGGKESFYAEFHQIAYEVLPRELFLKIGRLAGERLDAKEEAQDEETEHNGAEES